LALRAIFGFSGYANWSEADPTYSVDRVEDKPLDLLNNRLTSADTCIYNIIGGWGDA